MRAAMLSCGFTWLKTRNVTHSHNRTRLLAFLTASLRLATIIVHNRNSSQWILSFVLVLPTTHCEALFRGVKLNISKAPKLYLRLFFYQKKLNTISDIRSILKHRKQMAAVTRGSFIRPTCVRRESITSYVWLRCKFALNSFCVCK